MAKGGFPDDDETGTNTRHPGDLLAQAQQHGLTLEAYAEKVLRERVSEPSRPALTRSQTAGQRIRELRKGVTLGGLSIRDMIEDGRE